MVLIRDSNPQLLKLRNLVLIEPRVQSYPTYLLHQMLGKC